MTNRDGSPRGPQWLGVYGEDVAAAWLRSQRCRILGRNFKGPNRGEVDVVARRGKLLLFVEVKTRRQGARIRGYDAVNRTKRALIERGANAWLRKLGRRDLPWRFDVIEVTVSEGERPRIRHIENAF